MPQYTSNPRVSPHLHSQLIRSSSMHQILYGMLTRIPKSPSSAFPRQSSIPTIPEERTQLHSRLSILSMSQDCFHRDLTGAPWATIQPINRTAFNPATLALRSSFIFTSPVVSQYPRDNHCQTNQLYTRNPRASPFSRYHCNNSQTIHSMNLVYTH